MNDIARTEFSKQLDRGFAAITLLIDKLMQEVHGKSDTIIRLNTEFQYLRRAVENLEYVVIDGNGQRPLTTRVATLEQLVESLEEELKDTESFKRNTNLAVMVAILGGVLSWIPLMIQYLRG